MNHENDQIYTELDAVIDQLDEARAMLTSLAKIAPEREKKQIAQIDRRLVHAAGAAHTKKVVDSISTPHGLPVTDQHQPISVRNKNPGNLRPTAPNASKWRGEIPTDNAYAKFKDVVHGTRAMLYLLRISYPGHGINTISGIIDRYAPAGDNAADSRFNYKRFISDATGRGVTEQLDLTSKNTITAIAKAICAFESGHRDDHELSGIEGTEIINEAWDMLPL